MISFYTILTRLFVVAFDFPLSTRPTCCAFNSIFVSERIDDAGFAEQKNLADEGLRTVKLTISHLSMRMNYPAGLFCTEVCNYIWRTLTHGFTIRDAKALEGG
jgi:hypothetical protein